MDRKSRKELEQVMDELGLSDGPWTKHWARSEEFDGEPASFLDRTRLESAGRTLRLRPEITGLLIDSWSVVQRNPALERYFHHCRHILLDREKFDHRHWMELPVPEEESHLFFAFVLLSVLPEALELHRRRGIPENISMDTLSDLELWIDTYRQRYDRWGFGERSWLFHHFRGDLYRLGRLQFLWEPFPDDLHVFRHRRDHRTLLLPAAGHLYRQDGQYDGACGRNAPAPLQTLYREEKGFYTGTRISPEGCLTAETVSLLQKDWLLVLEKGAPALSFHIPALGPMEWDQCRKSFAQALDFYAAYFPDRPNRAFFSHSWLYDSQLRRYLPSESNILRFQRSFTLYPLQGTDDGQILERVFHDRFRTLEDAPQNTSLQRAVVRHMKDGGRWYTSGALLLPADIS